MVSELTEQPAEDATSGTDACSAILLIAYHFPPDASSTGRLRTLGFARHLPAHGWRPVVLAPTPRAYERVDVQGLSDVPADLPVYRTPAIDARRHLGWRGKYSALTAVPDRWVSWWPTAVARGLALIRRHRVRVIWSTYPIGTTHLVALTLSRITGLPWIADFRDPVVPAGTALQQRAMKSIERRTMDCAKAVVFTTPGARASYARRFPALADAGRLHVIPNGFEDESLATIAAPPNPTERDVVKLVHSGLLYPKGRNPEPFFEALSQLKRDGVVGSTRLRVTLRASGSEDIYQRMVETLDITDMVDLAPPIPYQDALAEQAAAHGLLLFQGTEFNAQIPAKIFEYLRIGRPVFALIGAGGDTAALLDETGGAAVAPIDDAQAIADKLRVFLGQIRAAQQPSVDERALARYTRSAGTAKLAGLAREIELCD
ncbi:hypothetical protein T31B1_10358 [Salinisphaera sp. T31B1]